MLSFDLLTPWIVFALTLALLLFIQRWIQRHLFGVGWIMSQEKHLATVLYFMALFPGVFIHELSHWIVAGVVNVKTTRSMKWPEADGNGYIEPTFIKVEETKNPFFLTLIGAAPFAAGLALVLWISLSVLHLPEFISALSTADLNIIGGAFQALVSQPDFVLWFYLLFAFSNTMLPGKEDRRGWEVIIAIAVGALVFLVVIGYQNVVIRWLSGPIPAALNSLTAIFAMVFVIDCLFAILIAVVEIVMERTTQRQAPYKTAQATALAASARARAAAPKLTSIYQYRLPIPLTKDVRAAPPATALPKPAQPAMPPPTPRPAIAAPSTPAAPAAAKPMFTPGPAPSRPAGAPPAAKPGEPARQPEPLRPAAGLTPRPSTSAPPPPTPPRPALPASTTPPRSPTLPVPAKPGAPSTTPPRSPFGAPPPRSPAYSANRDDEPDYIDADVIEDDEVAADEPAFMKGLSGSKPATSQPKRSPSSLSQDDHEDEDNGDDDDKDGLTYVDLDEVN